MIADELIALILTFIDSGELLKILKEIHPTIFGNVLRKYGKMFRFNFTNSKISDKDLYYLKGVYDINLSNCNEITDAGL